MVCARGRARPGGARVRRGRVGQEGRKRAGWRVRDLRPAEPGAGLRSGSSPPRSPSTPASRAETSCSSSTLVTRLARAQREIGLAAGSGRRGRATPRRCSRCCPSLLERTGNSAKGYCTAHLHVSGGGRRPGGPRGRRGPRTPRRPLRPRPAIAELGPLAGIDVLASLSRVMPQVTTGQAPATGGALPELLAAYEQRRDLTAGAYAPGNRSAHRRGDRTPAGARGVPCPGPGRAGRLAPGTDAPGGRGMSALGTLRRLRAEARDRQQHAFARRLSELRLAEELLRRASARWESQRCRIHRAEARVSVFTAGGAFASAVLMLGTSHASAPSSRSSPSGGTSRGASSWPAPAAGTRRAMPSSAPRRAWRSWSACSIAAPPTCGSAGRAAPTRRSRLARATPARAASGTHPEYLGCGRARLFMPAIFPEPSTIRTEVTSFPRPAGPAGKLTRARKQYAT